MVLSFDKIIIKFDMNGYKKLADSDEFTLLREVSSKLGKNPLQIQGAGGNTSLKGDGAMWIKASGAWLAEASKSDIMVPVALDALRQAVFNNDGRAADVSAFMQDAENSAGLKASIETSMHAIIEWPVVLHTHCVATIAATLRADIREYLTTRLSGLSWEYIPYTKPGLDLARALVRSARKNTQVFVLGNHGLVVCGDKVQEAESLLLHVSQCLEPDSIMESIATDYTFGKRLQATGWCPVDYSLTGAIAMDQARLNIAVGNSLYPDHLVFLGSGALAAEAGCSPEKALSMARGTKKSCKLLFFRGEGAAIPDASTPSMKAMARALGDVLARTDPAMATRSLTSKDELGLLNWDAEKHRKLLNASPNDLAPPCP